MKTTIDLPPGIVKGIKLRAVRAGQTIQATATDLLRAATQKRVRLLPAPKTLPFLKARRIGASRLASFSDQQMSDWIKAEERIEAELHEKAVGR